VEPFAISGGFYHPACAASRTRVTADQTATRLVEENNALDVYLTKIYNGIFPGLVRRSACIGEEKHSAAEADPEHPTSGPRNN